MITQDHNFHLLLDTSVLRSLSTDHVLVGFIRSLTERRKIFVYVPRVVRDEYRTQLEQNERESIEACLKTLANLPTRTQTLAMETLKLELEGARNHCASVAAESVTKAIVQWGAVEYDVHVEDLNEALDAYFSGSGPVRSVKYRQDIPDALIWAAMKRLARSVGHVHVLVKDGGLFTACQKVSSLTPHKSLHGFLSTPPASNLLRWEVIGAPAEWIEALERHMSYFQSYVSERVGDALYGQQCWIDLRPGSASWEQFGDAFVGDVVGGKIVSDISFQMRDAQVVGGRYIAAPFETLVDVEVEIHDSVIYVGPQFQVSGTVAVEVGLDESAWNKRQMTPDQFALLIAPDNIEMEIDEFQYKGGQEIWRAR